jgi:hypothetical protein
MSSVAGRSSRSPRSRAAIAARASVHLSVQPRPPGHQPRASISNSRAPVGFSLPRTGVGLTNCAFFEPAPHLRAGEPRAGRAERTVRLLEQPQSGRQPEVAWRDNLHVGGRPRQTIRRNAPLPRPGNWPAGAGRPRAPTRQVASASRLPRQALRITPASWRRSPNVPVVPGAGAALCGDGPQPTWRRCCGAQPARTSTHHDRVPRHRPAALAELGTHEISLIGGEAYDVHSRLLEPNALRAGADDRARRTRRGGHALTRPTSSLGRAPDFDHRLILGGSARL